jgi:putative transposase
MFDYLDVTRKGNCWDNAVAERLFKTLKSELIYHENYKTIEQTKDAWTRD